MKKVNRHVTVRLLDNPQEYMREYSVNYPETLSELVEEYGEEEVLKICRRWIEQQAREYNRWALVTELKAK